MGAKSPSPERLITPTLLETWRAPTSSATIHNLPFGLKSFAKPYMAPPKRRRSYWTFRCNFLRQFCEAMSGFAKLLSPKGKLWIVALLLGVKLFNWRAKKHSSTFNVYFPCLRAFRCQTWIRKIDERIVALNYQAIELILLNFLRRFYEAVSGFAKLSSP